MLRKFTLNGKHVCNTLSEGSKKTDDNECLGECESVCVCVCVCVCVQRQGVRRKKRENTWENVGN